MFERVIKAATSEKGLKVIGLICSGIGFGVNLLSEKISKKMNDKELERLVEEKVAERIGRS